MQTQPPGGSGRIATRLIDRPQNEISLHLIDRAVIARRRRADRVRGLEHGLGQVFGEDDLAAAQHNRALDRVFELPNITRPLVMGEIAERVG